MPTYKISISNIIIFILYIISYSICEYTNISVVNIEPYLEFAQNDTHIFVHIINKENLPIENIKANLTKNELFIYYEIALLNEGKIYKYSRNITLFSLAKNDSLVINCGNPQYYVLIFTKLITTFFWIFLDAETSSHRGISTWFEMYEKYDEVSKIGKYRNFVDDNLMDKFLKENAKTGVYYTVRRIEKIGELNKIYGQRYILYEKYKKIRSKCLKEIYMNFKNYNNKDENVNLNDNENKKEEKKNNINIEKNDYYIINNNGKDMNEEKDEDLMGNEIYDPIFWLM